MSFRSRGGASISVDIPQIADQIARAPSTYRVEASRPGQLFQQAHSLFGPHILDRQWIATLRKLAHH
jgi:hypothetical protein